MPDTDRTEGGGQYDAFDPSVARGAQHSQISVYGGPRPCRPDGCERWATHASLLLCA